MASTEDNDDNPVISPDGTKCWYRNGKWHRDDDLPAIEHGLGSRYWYQNGELHRDRGPAIEHDYGTKCWCRHGKFHRDGGLPAVEHYDGRKTWYFDGKEVLPPVGWKRDGIGWRSEADQKIVDAKRQRRRENGDGKET